jgi:hypothetical protein
MGQHLENTASTLHTDEIGRMQSDYIFLSILHTGAGHFLLPASAVRLAGGAT